MLVFMFQDCRYKVAGYFVILLECLPCRNEMDLLKPRAKINLSFLKLPFVITDKSHFM